MNERIKLLCEQSKAYSNECTKDFNGDEPVVWMDYYTEKFAELIVQECAEVAGCNAHVSGFALGDVIREYFGVESGQ